MSDRPLLARMDGELLPEKDARDLWARFSAHMEEHRGDLGGFAKAEGLTSIRPSVEDGAAILLASHTETQAPYRNVSAEDGPSKSDRLPSQERRARSSRGSGKNQLGGKTRHRKG
ncbi:MAG: hypothetical protein ABI183_16660 [Polyangiaceae bacterium]